MVVKTEISASYRHVSSKILVQLPQVFGKVSFELGKQRDWFQLSLKSPVNSPLTTLDRFIKQFALMEHEREAVAWAFPQEIREYGSIGDEDYCEIGTIHSFCLANIFQPFHYFLPEFESGFNVISPDSEVWNELIFDLTEKYGLDNRRTDVFTNIHREPDNTLFVPPEIPDEAASELIDFLDENGLVSFSDIVYHSCRLIENVKFIARGLGSRFAWMLIDEFQDTTDGQVAIIRTIARHGKTKFFLVGDPNQSIMSFAGAHPSLMQTFPKEINARTNLTLYGNYRSSQRIVNHAERLIRTDPRMYAVGLWKDFTENPQKYHVESRIAGIVDY